MAEKYRGISLIEDGFIQTTVDKAKPVTATQYKASVQGILVRGTLKKVQAKLDILLGPRSKGKEAAN